MRKFILFLSVGALMVGSTPAFAAQDSKAVTIIKSGVKKTADNMLNGTSPYMANSSLLGLDGKMSTNNLRVDSKGDISAFLASDNSSLYVFGSKGYMNNNINNYNDILISVLTDTGWDSSAKWALVISDLVESDKIGVKNQFITNTGWNKPLPTSIAKSTVFGNVGNEKVTFLTKPLKDPVSKVSVSYEIVFKMKNGMISTYTESVVANGKKKVAFSDTITFLSFEIPPLDPATIIDIEAVTKSDKFLLASGDKIIQETLRAGFKDAQAIAAANNRVTPNEADIAESAKSNGFASYGLAMEFKRVAGNGAEQVGCGSLDGNLFTYTSGSCSGLGFTLTSP